MQISKDKDDFDIKSKERHSNTPVLEIGKES